MLKWLVSAVLVALAANSMVLGGEFLSPRSWPVIATCAYLLLIVQKGWSNLHRLDSHMSSQVSHRIHAQENKFAMPMYTRQKPCSGCISGTTLDCCNTMCLAYVGVNLSSECVLDVLVCCQSSTNVVRFAGDLRHISLSKAHALPGSCTARVSGLG
jgi:hypothetical protein